MQRRIGIPNDELPVRGSTGYNVSTSLMHDVSAVRPSSV